MISIAICTHNEGKYVTDLVNRLISYHTKYTPYPGTFEFLIVDDFSTEPETVAALEAAQKSGLFRVVTHALNGDYATHKNVMNSQCSGEWILNLDADEFITDELLYYLPSIIEENPEVEAYWFPRINTVEGLTPSHIQKWGWVITALEFDGMVKPVVNWPDAQMRLYRNNDEIHWVGRVHERLNGFKTFSNFPMEPVYAIRHFKEISRQEAQNSYYQTLV